jgi:hypothetical protein
VDETTAEVNRERGFGPSPTRRGEILIRHPGLDLTKPEDMEMWQKMNAAVNQIRDTIKNISVSIEIVVSLPGIRPKRIKWDEGP